MDIPRFSEGDEVRVITGALKNKRATIYTWNGYSDNGQPFYTLLLDGYAVYFEQWELELVSTAKKGV